MFPEITVYKYINVSIQLTSCMILLILLLSLIGGEARTRRTNLFLTIVVLHLISTLCNVAAWISAGRPEPVFRALLEAGTFLTYASESFTGFLFYLYLQASMDNNVLKEGYRYNSISRGIFFVVGALSVLMAIFIIINLWNGAVYTFEEDNIIRPGGLYWLPNIAFIIQITLSAVQLLLIRRYFDKRYLRNLIFFMLMPYLTLLVGIMNPFLELSFPMTIFALLLIHMNVHQEQEKRLANHERELANNEKLLAQKELELAGSRTAIMLSQIQPHFLYNALNSIKNLCYKDPDAAANMVSEFADYLRENMDSLTQKDLVSFEREMEHTQVYLKIEKQRFRERLEVCYDLRASDFALPILTVQPLAENAVQGVTQRIEGGKITISAREDNSHWRVSVEDNGVGFDPAQPTEDGQSHIGIKNVRERLRSLCGGALTVESAVGKGTICTILIPKKALNGREKGETNESYYCG